MDDNGNDFIIICFFKRQAELINQKAFTSFIIDVNYKHLAISEYIEVIWGWFSPISQQGIYIQFNS
jgi:hypothetical protein